MCVCVCVVISFILDVKLVDAPAGVTQLEEGYTAFLHLSFAVLALIFIARRIQTSLSLVDREVKIRRYPRPYLVLLQHYRVIIPYNSNHRTNERSLPQVTPTCEMNSMEKDAKQFTTFVQYFDRN